MSDAPRPRLRRNLVFSTLTAASAGLMLWLSAIAGRRLSEDVFGQFMWVITFATMAEVLMDLGLHQITVRAIARDRSQAARLLHNSLALKILPGLGMFLVMGVTAYVLRDEVDVRIACLLMLGSAVLRSYLLTVRGILLGLERFDHESVVVILDRVLVLAACSWALLHNWGLIGVAVMFVAARVVAFVAALVLARSLVGSLSLGFDLPLWRDLQRQALPVGAFLIVLNFYSYIDTIMLGVLSTDADTGAYGAAYQLYQGFSYLPAILSSVLAPRLAALWTTDRAGHRRMAWQGIGAAAGLAVMVAIPVWLVARPLLTAIFTGASDVDYGAAALTLRILVSGLGFIFVIWILQALAISVDHERLLISTTTIGAVFNVALNFALIPRYGRNGAATATLLGEALSMGLLLYRLRAVLRRPLSEPH